MTCCHLDFSKKPSANAGVKKSERKKNNPEEKNQQFSLPHHFNTAKLFDDVSSAHSSFLI